MHTPAHREIPDLTELLGFLGHHVMYSSGSVPTLEGMARSRSTVDHARRARIRRDDSLGLVTRVTKSVGIGILAATGVLGLYLSKALPGHAATTSNTTSPAASHLADGILARVLDVGSSSSGSTQLSPPSSPPVQSQQPAPVVSGAT